MADVTEVKEVTATPVAVSASDEKQGAICCGCCCDYRRAVIVLAILGIVSQAINFILAIVGVTVGSSVAADIEGDDDVMEDLSAAAEDVSEYFGWYAIGFAVAICFYVFQLFAALKYNVCMLATVVVFDLISMAYNVWYSAATSEDAATTTVGVIFYVAIHCLFIYPTVGLLMEIRNGIMSVETYPREAHSCCCDPKV